MDFNPEDEDEFIREAVSHKLDRFLVKPSNKVWRYSTQTKSPTSPFQISNSLIYEHEGQNEMVELVDVNTNDPDSIKFIIKFLVVNTIVVTMELLKSRNVSDIGEFQFNYRNI